MYDKSMAALSTTAATTGTLAMTGANLVWIVLAAFALIATGLAMLRIIPRSQA